MGDLDDTSLLLGELKSELREAARQRDAMFRKLDVLQTQLSELAGALKLVAEKGMGLEKVINEELKPQIENFKELKNRGYGVIAVIGLISAGLGGFISSLFGHGS